MTEKVNARWEGIASALAVLGLTAIAVAAIMESYDCRYVTLMVVGIAGLGGFTYKRYLNGGSGRGG